MKKSFLIGLLCLITSTAQAQADFNNLNYALPVCTQEFGAPLIVTVRDGEYVDDDVLVNVDSTAIIIDDIIPDGFGAQDILVPVYCGPFGANYSYANLLLYASNNGQLELVAQLTEKDFQAAYESFYPNGTLWSEISSVVVSPVYAGALHINKPADGAHCCPETNVEFIYQWQGDRFALAGKPERSPLAIAPPPPPPYPPPPEIIGNSYYLNATTDRVNVLTQAGPNAAVLISLSNDATVTIVDVTDTGWMQVETAYTQIDGLPHGYLPASAINFAHPDDANRSFTTVRYSFQPLPNSGLCPNSMDSFELNVDAQWGSFASIAIGLQNLAYNANLSYADGYSVNWTANMQPEFNACTANIMLSQAWIDGEQVAIDIPNAIQGHINNAYLNLQIALDPVVHDGLSIINPTVLNSGNPSYELVYGD